jgi:hypothetical protein
MRLIAVLLFAICGVTNSGAADFTFTRIVDTTTAIPGGSGNFVSFKDLYVSVDKGDVAFDAVIGTDGSGNPVGGIYTYIGGNLGVVADLDTPSPGGTGNFTEAWEPWLDSGSVAFGGSGSNGQWGYYTNLGGSLRVVADTNTPIPGQNETFSFFQDTASLNAGAVSFLGYGGNSGSGIYVDKGGSLEAVAQTGTPVPGHSTESFQTFGEPTNANGGDVVFSGNYTGGYNGAYVYMDGIYMDANGTLTTLVDNDNPVLGGNKISIGDWSFENNNLAFTTMRLTDSPPWYTGLYSTTGGVLHLVADDSTPIPGATGNFLLFDRPSLDGNNLAFAAADSNSGWSIYSEIGGQLSKVIGVGDLLDNKTVTSMNMGDFNGGTIGFSVEFADGSSGVYLANVVPIPSTLWLFGTGLLGLVGVSRRKKVD